MYRVNQYPPPSPSSSRGRWILLGVGVGIVASLAVAGAASLLVLRRGREKPPSPVIVAATAAPAAGTASVGPAIAITTAVPEGPPPTPGTPESSLKARPAWGVLEIGVRGEATLQYAPQHSKPLETFLAASPLAETKERAFVVCRFQSFNKADTFAGDDLHVRARFGETPEVAADGPEDGNLGFVSAPLVSLKRQMPMRFEVYDRDVFSLGLLTRQSTTWSGGPLTMTDAGASTECRSLSDEPLARAVTREGTKADEAVHRVSSHELDAYRSDWGYPTFEMSQAHRAVGDIAALAGWDDPRTRKRVDALAAVDARLEGERPRLFDALYASAQQQLTYATLHVAIDRVTCANRCVVHVTIENQGVKPMRHGAFGGFSAYVATAKSGPVFVTATSDPPGTVEIAPGASVAMTFVPVADLSLGSEPSLLGICYESRCQPLKLH